MDEKEEAAFNFLTAAAKELANRDEHTIFGQMVASQLRNLSRAGQIAARHAIHNVLYHQELKELHLVSEEQARQIPASADSRPSNSSSDYFNYRPNSSQSDVYQDYLNVCEDIESFGDP